MLILAALFAIPPAVWMLCSPSSRAPAVSSRPPSAGELTPFAAEFRPFEPVFVTWEGCVLGDPVRNWHDLDLAAIGGGLWVNGTKFGAGCGADILGHPLNALAWIARRWRELGLEPEAGTVVTLGSLVQTVWVDRGDRIEVEIDGLGVLRHQCVAEE